MWDRIYQWMDERGEGACKESFQRFYMHKDSEDKWAAGWCGALAVPGSYSGTQAQERWHGSRRPSLTHTRIPAGDVVSALQRLCKSRVAQAKLKTEPLYDIPSCHWSKYLQQEAKRALALPEFFRKSAGEDGTVSYIFRQEYSEDAIEKFKTKATAEAMVKVRSLLLEGVLPTGAGDLAALCDEVARWVLVLLGPEATRRWRLTPDRAIDLPPASHHHAVCLNCHCFAVNGTCLHSYAAMMDAGIIGQQVPWSEPHRAGRGKKRSASCSVVPSQTKARPESTATSGKLSTLAAAAEDFVQQCAFNMRICPFKFVVASSMIGRLPGKSSAVNVFQSVKGV